MAIGGSRVSFQTPVIRNQQPATTIADAQLDDAQYKFGPTSLYLDGTTDSVRTGTTGLIFANGSPFTVECWFRSDGAFRSYNGIVGLGNTHTASGNNFMAIYVRGDGSDVVWTAWGFNLIIGGNTKVTANTWTHAAVQRHANNLCELYVGGIKQNSTATINRDLGQNAGGYIGAFTDGLNTLKGWVDEVRISNITRYSGSSFTTPSEPFINDANTVYLYHMDGPDAGRNIVDDIT